MRDIEEVLAARSVAVVGASSNPAKPGAMLIDVLKETGFDGLIVGVNPAGGSYNGVPLYRRLGDIPHQVDLAVMIIPPQAVPAAAADCAAAGVKGVVISTEGFAETGEAGREYQEQLADVLRDSGMRCFGPNTLGVINTATGLTTSYFVDRSMLKPGGIGVAAQSGIFVGALLRYISTQGGLGLSKGLGLGNKVDVDESDALRFFRRDEQTRAAGLYVEDIRDGRRFADEARRTSAVKPVLLVKGGRSEAGNRAVASHTASMAVNDAVLDGVLRQSGVVRLDSVEEMIAALTAFDWMPPPKGDRLALVTYSGAQAIMSLDEADRHGLYPARLSPAAREKIGSVIRTGSKARNPIDIFPDMMNHGFEKTCSTIVEALLEDEGVDGIIVLSFAMGSPAIFEPVVETIQANLAKPVFFSLLGAREDVREAGDFLLDRKMPFSLFPEIWVKSFGAMRRYARYKDRLQKGEHS